MLLYQNVSYEGNAKWINMNLDKLVEWSITWQMRFNMDKSEIIYRSLIPKTAMQIINWMKIDWEKERYKWKFGHQLLKQNIQVQWAVWRRNGMQGFNARYKKSFFSHK